MKNKHSYPIDAQPARCFRLIIDAYLHAASWAGIPVTALEHEIEDSGKDEAQQQDASH
jgi:hypothetical protein